MKKSELIKIIKEEVKNVLYENPNSLGSIIDKVVDDVAKTGHGFRKEGTPMQPGDKKRAAQHIMREIQAGKNPKHKLGLFAKMVEEYVDGAVSQRGHKYFSKDPAPNRDFVLKNATVEQIIAKLSEY